MKYSSEPKNLEMLKNFNNLLYSIAPLNKFATNKFLSTQSGSLIEALLFVNIETRKIVPLKEAKEMNFIERNKKLKSVSIIYTILKIFLIHREFLGCSMLFLSDTLFISRTRKQHFTYSSR